MVVQQTAPASNVVDPKAQLSAIDRELRLLGDVESEFAGTQAEQVRLQRRAVELDGYAEQARREARDAQARLNEIGQRLSRVRELRGHRESLAV